MIGEVDVKQRHRLHVKYARQIELLRKDRFGSFHCNDKFIINLSDYTLSSAEKELLCRGMSFGLPPKTNREEVMADFEVFYDRLSSSLPKTNRSASVCATSLADIANQYIQSSNDTTCFTLTHEHFRVRKELRSNNNIVITKPDKGRATVIMNKHDYITKTHTILNDSSKFTVIGPIETHDKTAKIEEQLCNYFKELVLLKQITQTESDSFSPIGSARPRMYGLPKIHKAGCPVRPILSMCGSPQYKVSRWICRLLQPVLDMYSTYVVKDSFEFADFLHDHEFPETFFMCSFDVVSLFTNVPLDFTIDICCDAMYRGNVGSPVTIEETYFRRLMNMVTSGVEFSFENVMYRQIDCVAMGSPLGPVLANIFVSYCESLVPKCKWPAVYCRFVDDSWSYFQSRSDAQEFLELLNKLHPSLKFTCEFESASKLSFLDVLVEKSGMGGVITSVYRKPTFTGLYIVWDSFTARSYKINLVRNLVDRARRLCSPSKLDEELERLRTLFRLNGYPEYVISKYVVVSTLGGAKEVSSDATPVYLRLPWKGEAVCRTMQRRVKSAVESNFRNVSVRFVYTTARAFMVKKDVLPTLKLSHLIYNFECRQCESRYVGRTLQHLEARIHQHVPLHVMPVEARSSRPRRGRPPKIGTATGGAPSLGTEPTGVSLSSSSASACSSLPSSLPSLPSIPSSSLVSAVSSSLTSLVPSSGVSTSGGKKRGRPPKKPPDGVSAGPVTRSRASLAESLSSPSLSSSSSSASSSSPSSSSSTSTAIGTSKGASSQQAVPVTDVPLVLTSTSASSGLAVAARNVRSVTLSRNSKVCTGSSSVVRVYESSIANHLVQNSDCRSSYADDCFSVWSRSRSQRYLRVLESIYIFTTKPILCRQKRICLR